MKKTFKIDVDCANCAAKIEEGIKNLDCVKDAKEFHDIKNDSRI